MITKKTNSYCIPFIVNVINGCHSNSRVVKRRQQEKKYIVKIIYCENACDHKVVKGRQQEKNIIMKVLVATFEPSGLPPLNISHIKFS